MGQVIIRERIYVNGKGKRVGEDYSKAKTLAAVPGDVLSEERAAALGVKASPPAADKAAGQSANKGAKG